MTGTTPLRVLMVCYHFPPMSTTGGLRPARFVKYFPENVRADVLTVADPMEPRNNIALFEDVLNRCTLSTAPMKRWLAWQTRDDLGGLRGWLGKVHKTLMSMVVWIPDRQVSWVPGAMQRGAELLGERDYDVLFCTCPPHSLALVGRNLKRRTGVPLVLDFRDPWTDNPQRHWRTKLRKLFERRLERSALAEADAIIANTAGNREMLLESFPDLDPGRVHVITNGFDPDRGQAMRAQHAPNEPRRILFTGHVYEGTEIVADALQRLLEQDPDLPRRVRFEFIGTRDRSVGRRFYDLVDAGLVTLYGWMPNDTIPSQISLADALLYAVPPTGQHWIPSKLYDYLLAEKPILGLLPRGDAWSILESSGLATLVETGDVAAMAGGVGDFLARLSAGEVVTAPRREAIDAFDARTLTRQLVDVFAAVARPG